MRTILTDENNDIYLVGGNIAMAEDKQAVAQIVNNILRTQRGELSYNIDRGIPYLETVLGDNPDVNLWASYMMSAIKGISYVNRIISFIPQVDYETNTLKFISRISTIYGDITINDNTI